MKPDDAAVGYDPSTVPPETAQMLAAMGTLLEYLKAPPPVDSAPIDLMPIGLPAYSFPTPRLTLPQTGSEPLRVSTAAVGASAAPLAYAAATEPQEGFTDRWPRGSAAARMLGAQEWFAQKSGRSPGQVTTHVDPTAQSSMSYASANDGTPHWLLSAFPSDRK